MHRSELGYSYPNNVWKHQLPYFLLFLLFLEKNSWTRVAWVRMVLFISAGVSLCLLNIHPSWHLCFLNLLILHFKLTCFNIYYYDASQKIYASLLVIYRLGQCWLYSPNYWLFLKHYPNYLLFSIFLFATKLVIVLSIFAQMVFSSSATVYGQPEKIPCVEDFELKAMNPYGRTKVMASYPTILPTFLQLQMLNFSIKLVTPLFFGCVSFFLKK